MNYPLVSVIIPTYNRKEKLTALLKSILKSDYPKSKLEIIVVDDYSTDGTYNLLKRSFPDVIIIKNDEEKLLAQSRNIGAQSSHGEYIFFIDDDNVIDPSSIKRMVQFMEENPEVGVIGPIMYSLKDPGRIWCAGIERSDWTTITSYVGCNTLDINQFEDPFESEDFPNAFMVRQKVIQEIGLFNSRLFPIHYDEADFCRKVKRGNYKVMTVPSARIWHDIELANRGKSKILHLKSSLRAYYSTRNRVIFHRKWSSNSLQKLSAIAFSMGIALYYIYITLVEGDGNKWDKVKKLLKGYVDGLKVP